MPEISVIIPAYNSAKYIHECILSVLNQTFNDYEIIVIDDGSKDTTAQVIKSFDDPRIKYIYQKNSGPHIARNRGLDEATGEYIAFLDSDDVWYPHKLEVQLNKIKNDPEIGLVFNWVHFIDKDSRLIGGYKYRIYSDFYANLLLQNFVSNGSVPLVRKKCFEKAGKFLDTTPAEDWDMWLRIAKYYKFYCIDDYLVKYRHHPKSLSRNVKKMEASAVTIIEREFKTIDKKLYPLKKKAYSNKYFYYSDLCRQDNKKREALHYWLKAIKIDPITLLNKATRARFHRIFVPDKEIRKLKSIFTLRDSKKL